MRSSSRIRNSAGYALCCTCVANAFTPALAMSLGYTALGALLIPALCGAMCAGVYLQR